MNIRPIRTEDDYRAALAHASIFFDHEPEPASAEGNDFAVLLTLIQAYEAKHFPVESHL